MNIVTVNLPNIYMDAIAKICDAGLFSSRSEVIRVALREFLKVELEMVESLIESNDNVDEIEVEKEMKPSSKKPQTVTKKIDMRSIRAGWW